MLISLAHESFIGIEVTLPNSVITCQEWVIADVNHDGTSGTVDLFSKYTLELRYSGVEFGLNNIYKGSELDARMELKCSYFDEDVYNALLNYEVRIENDKNYIVA